MARLGENRWGKSDVRVSKIHRSESGDDFLDLTVQLLLQGDVEAAHVLGDNRGVLPTDTMKNTVYALAAREGVQEPEPFGLALASHFIERNPRLRRVRVDLTEHLWTRAPGPGGEHGTAFLRAGPETRTAAIEMSRTRTLVGAGLADLVILKSAGSAFSGFLRDELTTLAETRDRLLATSLTATWRYRPGALDYRTLWHGVRHALLERFAQHESESVQHTLHAMGQAVLESIGEVSEIRLVMPNRHHLPVDLTPFGLANRNEIFVPTEEPYGLIEATIVRDRPAAAPTA